MGRFDADDEYDPLVQGRWRHNIKATIHGRKGQQALKDLRRYLLAMSEKRLIDGWLATPDGECCTVGLFVAGRRADRTGCTIREAAAELAEGVDNENDLPWDQLERVGPGEYLIAENQLPEWTKSVYDRLGNPVPKSARTVSMSDGDQATIDAGVAAGLTRTLAWCLGDLNDESLAVCTPEERWQRVLRWVEKRIDCEPSETRA